MMNLSSVLKKLLDVLIYIFCQVRKEYKKLVFSTKSPNGEEKIEIQDLISDFLEVFRPTRIFFFFNLIAFLIFVLLPQGKDVILIVTEDLAGFGFGSLISLIIGTMAWAILAEFGARYKIYISDNSGKTLTGSRVNYRKQLQRFMCMCYLLLPFVIVLASTVIVTLSNVQLDDWDWTVTWPFALTIIALILSSAFLARFYLDETFVNKFKNSNPGLARFTKLPEEERRWADRLYGIYNDYVFAIKKETIFYPEFDYDIRGKYERFTGAIKTIPPDEFPDGLIVKDEQAPVLFRPPVHFADEYKPDFSGINPATYTHVVNKGGAYRWIYKNNPAFYKVLHRQVGVIAITSFVVVLLISLNFFVPYEWIGAPGLVTLSFGCWQGIYVGLLFVDYRFRKKIFLSARWFLFFWFLIVSLINKDHPVRYNEQGKTADARLTLQLHFNSWFNNHVEDSVLKPLPKHNFHKNINTADSALYYPVIFITAEGGALRTGAFTAMLLAALQDSFPLFKNDVYAFSTISGGSVGVSFFNAINYLSGNNANKYTPLENKAITKDFFKKDHLSPVLAKMFYGDILNYFWPAPIQKFDRAIALEKSWENEYCEIFKKGSDKNIYSSGFLANCAASPQVPAWFINTTEVETGLQCFVSNVKPGDQFQFYDQRDLLGSKIRGGINYSTAVNFSSRFPLVSPSAAIKQDDIRTYHYVDGGYVENTGSKTMLEVLENLRDSVRSKRIIPYVIQLRFGTESGVGNTNWLNEIQSITSGIYNTRSGNSRLYAEKLKAYVNDTLDGFFIDIPLDASSSDVPMNWVLSKKSLNTVEEKVKGILNSGKNDLHQKLYWYDTNIFRHYIDTTKRQQLIEQQRIKRYCRQGQPGWLQRLPVF